jgi:hypothetical protein
MSRLWHESGTEPKSQTAKRGYDAGFADVAQLVERRLPKP